MSSTAIDSTISATATSTPGQEMFIRNMRALWHYDPTLAILVDAVPDDQRLLLEQTRSGHHTTQVTTSGGSKAYLHSKFDPVDEGKRFAASIEIEDKYCIAISGLGLGYHVVALFERLKGDAFILCLEPSLNMLATAFCCVDFSDLIASKRFILLTSHDKSRLHDRLQSYNTLIMLGAQFVQHPASKKIATSDFAPITKAVSEFVTYTRMTILTLLANARITCRNIAMNLVSYVATPPIDILRDRFAGNPAVVISAGPSLMQNIDQLKELKGKAVLCAVQTAIKPLMRRGIVPDFVTSLDFHQMSRKFFEDVGDLSDVHLVAEPKATWGVVDDYPGPVSLLDNAWASLLIGDELAKRDGLKAGATVSHLAYYLAVYLGCDPIIFVGQDLAYTGHVFYVPGVEVHHAWQSELNRYCSMEHKEWERIVRNRPIMHKVSANQGGQLYTDELLLTYLEQFETDIAQTPRTIINATEGGARIRGAKVMSLREASETYCTQEIDPSRLAYRQTTSWWDTHKHQAASKEITQRLDDIDQAITVCDELLDLFDELKELTSDPLRFNQRLVRVDELRTRIHQDSRAYRLINSFTQKAELQRYSADRKIEASEVDDTERAKRQLDRDKAFIQGVRQGAVELKPILTETLERINKAIPSS